MPKERNMKAYGLIDDISVKVYDIWTPEIRCEMRYRYASLNDGDKF